MVVLLVGGRVGCLVFGIGLYLCVFWFLRHVVVWRLGFMCLLFDDYLVVVGCDGLILMFTRL